MQGIKSCNRRFCLRMFTANYSYAVLDDGGSLLTIAMRMSPQLYSFCFVLRTPLHCVHCRVLRSTHYGFAGGGRAVWWVVQEKGEPGMQNFLIFFLIYHVSSLATVRETRHAFI